MLADSLLGLVCRSTRSASPHNDSIVGNFTWTIVESRPAVQHAIETASTYQGITLDERVALRQFIDTKSEDEVVQEQFVDSLLLQGAIK